MFIAIFYSLLAVLGLAMILVARYYGESSDEDD